MKMPAPNGQPVPSKMAVNALFIRFLCLGIVVAALIAAPSGRDGQPALPNWLLILTVLVLGVPHGALDFVKARRQLQLPALCRYVLAYIGVTAVSFYLLAQFPQWMMPLLLAVASWHFGETYRSIFYHPNAEEPRKYWLYAVSVLGAFAIGALPISLSLFSTAHIASSEAYPLFAAMGGTAAAQSTIAVWLFGMEFFFIMPLLGLGFGLWRVFRTSPARRFSYALDFLEILLTVAVFMFAPTLLAFTLYFCFVHAPRHTAFSLRELAGQFKPRLLLLEALTVSLASVALVWGLSMLLQQHGIPTTSNFVALLFSGLLSITVAHAAHDRICGFLR